MSVRSWSARGSAAALLVAAVTGVPAGAVQAPVQHGIAWSTPQDTGAGPCLNKQEAAFLGLINDYRKSKGRKPLAASKALDTASYLHSKDMADNDYFEHDSPNGDTPEDRMKGQGYAADATGENIAAGYPTAKEVFKTWENSPGHNENMLDKSYRVIGIGLAPGSSGDHGSNSEYDSYWTTDFGSKVDAAPSCG